jgi:hypothetical protein
MDAPHRPHCLTTPQPPRFSENLRPRKFTRDALLFLFPPEARFPQGLPCQIFRVNRHPLDAPADQSILKYMKTITLNVSEPVYAGFQRYAREKDRPTSELLREAHE